MMMMKIRNKHYQRRKIYISWYWEKQFDHDANDGGDDDADDDETDDKMCKTKSKKDRK